MQQDILLKMNDQRLISLRFDNGTVRKVKEMTGVDPMSGEAKGKWWETAYSIFEAAYYRSCKLHKTQPELTSQDLIDYFDELDINASIQVVRAFNDVMTVEVTPELMEAVKQSETLEQNSSVKSATSEASTDPEKETAPNAVAALTKSTE